MNPRFRQTLLACTVASLGMTSSLGAHAQGTPTAGTIRLSGLQLTGEPPTGDKAFIGELAARHAKLMAALKASMPKPPGSGYTEADRIAWDGWTAKVQAADVELKALAKHLLDTRARAAWSQDDASSAGRAAAAEAAKAEARSRTHAGPVAPLSEQLKGARTASYRGSVTATAVQASASGRIDLTLDLASLRLYGDMSGFTPAKATDPTSKDFAGRLNSADLSIASRVTSTGYLFGGATTGKSNGPVRPNNTLGAFNGTVGAAVGSGSWSADIGYSSAVNGTWLVGNANPPLASAPAPAVPKPAAHPPPAAAPATATPAVAAVPKPTPLAATAPAVQAATTPVAAAPKPAAALTTPVAAAPKPAAAATPTPMPMPMPMPAPAPAVVAALPKPAAPPVLAPVAGNVPSPAPMAATPKPVAPGAVGVPATAPAVVALAGTLPTAIYGVVPVIRSVASQGATRFDSSKPVPEGMKVLQIADGSYLVARSWNDWSTDPKFRPTAGGAPVGVMFNQMQAPVIATGLPTPPTLATALDEALKGSAGYMALSSAARAELVGTLSAAASRAVATMANHALTGSEARRVELTLARNVLLAAPRAAADLLPGAGNALSPQSLSDLGTKAENAFKQELRQRMTTCSAVSACTVSVNEAGMDNALVNRLAMLLQGVKSVQSTPLGTATATPGFAGYSYIDWSGFNDAVASASSGYSVQLRGAATQKLPALGTGKYSGAVAGSVVSLPVAPGQPADNVGSQSVAGRIDLTVNFAARSLSGQMSDLRTADGRPLVNPGGKLGSSAEALKQVALPVLLQGDFKSDALRGTLQTTDQGQTAKGSFNGAFFGPQAQELGATWSLDFAKHTAGGIFVANGAGGMVAPSSSSSLSPSPSPSPTLSPAPAIAPAPAGAVAMAPAPSPAKPVPVPVATPTPAGAAFPATGTFNSWAGTPKPGMATAPRELRPDGYSPSDIKQALYAGKSDAVVVNLRDKGSVSNVQGDIKLAVNLSARTVNGEIGNFVGSTGAGAAGGTTDASNFLNAGVVKVAASVDSRTLTVQGSAVWTPARTGLAPASGTFTGLFDKVTSIGSTGMTTVPGKLGQGSVSLGNADFKLNGSWKATLVPPGR